MGNCRTPNTANEVGKVESTSKETCIKHVIVEDDPEDTTTSTPSHVSRPSVNWNEKVSGAIPERLRTIMAPDVIVVVGEMKFYHYKIHLCSKIPFSLKTFSSGMKEAIKDEIKFPDKDPNTWLQICSLVDMADKDPEKHDTFRKTPYDEGMLKEYLLSSSATTDVDWLDLIRFCDYLGLNQWTKRLDRLYAKKIYDKFDKAVEDYRHDSWAQIDYEELTLSKGLPCPLSQKVAKYFADTAFDCEVYNLSIEQITEHEDADGDDKAVSEIKKYLLDDDIGEGLWVRLLSSIYLPDWYLRGMGRKDFIACGNFFYALEYFSRDMEDFLLPNMTFEEVIGEDTSTDADEEGDEHTETMENDGDGDLEDDDN